VGSVTLLIERLPFWRNQDSINIIWNLKAKPKRGWLKWVKDRLLSSSLIAGLSFFINCFFYGQRCFTCSKRLAEALFS
jgi:membrane protein